jgi:hypothetical protein
MEMQKTLATLRNPMVFNGLSVLTYLTIALVALKTENWPIPKIVFVALCLLLIALTTIWLNYFASKNPRFLAYGPEEYIHESELSHERIMAGIR